MFFEFGEEWLVLSYKSFDMKKPLLFLVNHNKIPFWGLENSDTFYASIVVDQ